MQRVSSCFHHLAGLSFAALTLIPELIHRWETKEERREVPCESSCRRNAMLGRLRVDVERL